MGTATTIRTETIGVEEAECPSDGGKWVIYHVHHLSDGMEAVSLLQDTNKRRLAEWKKHPTDWCCYCQEENEIRGEQ